MVLYVIFSDSVQTIYKTSVCSKATFIIYFINILTFFIPFLVAYRTQGLWLKMDTYREQPDVNFMYEYFIMLETNKIESPVICTTFKVLSSAIEEFNGCPVIKVKEDDYDKDGKKDKLYFEAESLLSATENVYSVTVLLLFNYKLYSHSWFEMESAAWLQSSSPLGGGRFQATGRLSLHQTSLFNHQGRDTRYNTSVVTATELHQFSLFDMIAQYADRNVSTRLENVYTVWTRGRSPDQQFILSLQISYPEEIIYYRPGLWHVLKLAWLQYLGLLYIAILLSRRLKHFVLDNRLVHNVKVTPWKKAM
ncbi:transmembrane protein 231 [Rhodnius prolixus]|uniref:transmembrane protein 231 n=1 Tax=Rhodnius prolixus TaxID=13249 RepID=UPI003D18BCBB